MLLAGTPGGREQGVTTGAREETRQGQAEWLGSKSVVGGAAAYSIVGKLRRTQFRHFFQAFLKEAQQRPDETWQAMLCFASAQAHARSNLVAFLQVTMARAFQELLWETRSLWLCWSLLCSTLDERAAPKEEL